MSSFTSNKLVKSFIASGHNHNAQLTIAVLKKISGSKKAKIKALKTIHKDGMTKQIAGFDGDDLVQFSRSMQDCILDAAYEVSNNLKIKCPYTVLSQWKHFKDVGFSVDEINSFFNDDVDVDTNDMAFFWNHLTFYAVEEVARWFSDFIEDENIELIES